MPDAQDKTDDPLAAWWNENAERLNKMGEFAYKNKLGMHGMAEAEASGEPPLDKFVADATPPGDTKE